MRYILLMLLPLVAIILGAFLALYGVSGWGWFLFIAFTSSPSVDYTMRFLGIKD